MTRLQVQFVALLAMLAAASSAVAQDYPNRRITIIVPFSPGTAFDVIARQAGQKMSERLGQPVVVDNKPGASVPVPTFVSHCSTRSYERRNQRDTSNYMILVWLWI
ncbi:MAG: hypothetical protein GEU91_05845 [Rhizobiales bacterium]|nr:hypothetical protein [Hyphomicrobiales bacterium]